MNLFGHVSFRDLSTWKMPVRFAICDTLPTRCGCHDETFSCQMFIVRQDSVSQDVWIERISILILRYIILYFVLLPFT